MNLRHRLAQGTAALRPVPDPAEAAWLTRWLDGPQQAAFRALAAHDRAHLIRVARGVATLAPGTPDLIVAALLHDLGKADDDRCRVRLIDRVANVLLRRFAPRLLDRLARMPAPRWRRGLALAVHHAALGADRAATLGCPPRVVDLIARHELRPVPDDADLRILAAVDDRDGDPPPATRTRRIA